MEIVSNIALISINETLIVQLISFLVFLLILNRIMIRPLRESMSQRTDYVEELGKSISTSEDEMTAITLQIKEQEATAVQEAHARRMELEAAGKEAADSMMNAARGEIGQMKVQVGGEIEKLLVQARERVEKESGLISISIMEKVLSRKLTT